MSAQVTISQLPTAGAITGTELVPVVQNGVTVQTTTSAIAGSPTQTYTYLTVSQTPQLANSRYVGATNGLTITDGGAQGLFNISTTGALLSLVNSGTGFQVKTSATALTPRSITVSNNGLSISNGSGVSGDPTISLTGAPLNLANASFNGLVMLSTAGAITSATAGTDYQAPITLTTTGTSGAATFSSNVLNIPQYTSNAGTVTSVAASVPAFLSVTGSPITTSGTLAISYSGTALPIANGGTALTTTPTNGQLLIGNGTGYTLAALTAGANISITNSAGGISIASTAVGTGTVTSVAQSFTGGLISVSGSPITTSGTLALTVAGTSGGVPYFSSASTWATSAALTQYGIVYGGGAGAAPVSTAAGTTGQTLVATTSAAPAWGTLGIAGGGTGLTSTPANGALDIGNGTGFTRTTLTAGSNITITNASGSITIAATASGSGTVTSVAQSFTGGIISVAGSPITSSGTLALTVAGTSGGIPYFSSASTWATSAALAANALMVGGGAGAAPSTITTGTGVVTALGVNTGSAGAFVVNGGALGAPSSGTVTNLTGTASININGTVGATTASTGAFTTVSATGVITSTVATGTAPFTVASTTQVANLNAATAGTAGNVTGTVAVANGGTGQTTASAAFNALSPITTTGDLILGNGTNSATRLGIGANGYVLTSNGTTASWAAGGGGGTVTSVAATVPSFLSITGSPITTTGTLAISYSGTALPIANGGTGATTQQAAINALVSTITNRYFLRGNGTNAVMAMIQAADVPTLNQDTTGTAANVTGTVAIANGGTALTTTPTNGQLLIGNGTNYTLSTLTAGSNITITNASGAITIASTGGGSGITIGKSIAMAMIFGY